VKAVPGIGAVKAAAALTEAGIQENRRVGGLTKGQRERLLEQVGQQ
jgi:ribosomal protein S13